jgi:hypothetical protein
MGRRAEKAGTARQVCRQIEININLLFIR